MPLSNPSALSNLWLSGILGSPEILPHEEDIYLINYQCSKQASYIYVSVICMCVCFMCMCVCDVYACKHMMCVYVCGMCGYVLCMCVWVYMYMW